MFFLVFFLPTAAGAKQDACESKRVLFSHFFLDKKNFFYLSADEQNMTLERARIL